MILFLITVEDINKLFTKIRRNVGMLILMITEKETIFVSCEFLFPKVVVLFLLDRFDRTIQTDVINLIVDFDFEYDQWRSRVERSNYLRYLGCRDLALWLIGEMVFEFFRKFLG